MLRYFSLVLLLAFGMESPATAVPDDPSRSDLIPDGWSHSTPDLDLDAAYTIHGTAIAYDWLYNWFTEEERRIIREKLAYQARLMFEASFLERMYWARTVQQNHY